MLSHLYPLNILLFMLICWMSIVTYVHRHCHTLYTFTTDVLSFVLSYQCSIYVLFACSMWFMFITHTIHLANILFLTCYICLHSACNVPVFSFTCDICLSVPCSTYTKLIYTIPTCTTYMYIRCLSVIHCVPCNLLLCGHCCYVIRCFATPFM